MHRYSSCALKVLQDVAGRVWNRTSPHDAAVRDGEFVQHFNQLRELGICESHVYEVADDASAALPVLGSDVKGNR